MRLLVDTHVLIWWLEGSPRMPASWIEALTDPANETLVSAASVWEIAVKARLGKLHLSADILDAATDYGYRSLDITAADALAAGSLDWDHKDPFDRMLVAQATERGLTLVTADAAVLAAPGVRFLS